MSLRTSTRAALAAALSAAVVAALPASASAAVDPEGCTPTVAYDPSVPTWDAHFGDGHNPDAKVPFAGGGTGTSPRNLTKVLHEYFDAVTAAVDASPTASTRVKIVKKTLGVSELGLKGVPGRDIAFWVIGTPANIAKLDTPGGDAEFWSKVRTRDIDEESALEAVHTRPAFAWITATPHGSEPAAGEAITRELYELAARTDCANMRRLASLDLFLMPVRNPDGRDTITRTTAWSFDPNRDFGTRNQHQNRIFIPEMNKYPGLFYIDAHQQSSGYFFPPNEDPVHHEISDFSLDFIQSKIGPSLQRVFNDQSGQYQNYNTYDLFTPEYGDTVPSLIMGAAGMTYEKGTSEAYGKQVYDHYLAIDTTVELTANDKPRILADWIEQWSEAVEQGASCKLQPNKLVSPLHDVITQQPDVDVCGYFYRPGEHSGDVARLIRELQEVGVKVYTLDTDVTVNGLREFGRADVTGTLPKGTLYIPMAQSQKHWIQAVLGEDPFIPYPFYYDVVTWSYSLQRGMAGNGFLTEQLPPGVTMTPLAAPDFGAVTGSADEVYAFDTDSMQALAMVVELLDEGVDVYRGTAAFTAAAHEFDTGAALVDGDSLRSAGVDLGALADERQTPVYGLDRHPVARKRMVTPKIGLYTGGATVPASPISATPGMCTTSGYCPALFGLTQKIGLPEGMVVPVTSADLAGGALVSGGFTAFVNAGSTIAAGPGATALQAFVNGGGIYLGVGSNGTTSARNAGMTNLTTTTIPGLLTPGSTFDATFDTTSPLAWGFDEGGWIYRSSSNDPVFTVASLTGNGGSIPDAEAAVSYATPLRTYGFQVNATGTGALDGRPAVVDQAFGTGRALLFGFDPFYRAWKEHDEREVLNALLYPLGAELPATTPAETRRDPGHGAAQAGDVTPAAEAVRASRLPAVGSRPVATTAVDADLRIVVGRRDAARLRRAVRAARLPRRIARKVRYVTGRSTVTLVIRQVRTADEHARQVWTRRLLGSITAHRVTMRSGQL